MNIDRRDRIDELAEKAGGFFSIPSEDELCYTDLLFSICDQFGIRYYTATEKEKCFVEEVTRVTWEYQHGRVIRPAFVG